MKRKSVKRLPPVNLLDSELLKAKNYAFLLLKYRLRSSQEIRDRLKRKKFSVEAIEAAINDLTENKFLDDAAFANAWIDYRLRNKMGIRKIRVELEAKGISKEIIRKQLDAVKGDYNEEGVIEGVIEQKIRKLNSPVDLTAKRRLYSFLLRRGFSPDIVAEKIKQL